MLSKTPDSVPVYVPMSQLDPSGFSFDRLDVMNANGTNVTFYVDAVRFLASSSAPTPTPTSAAAIPTPTRTGTPTRTSTPNPTPTSGGPTPTPGGGLSIYQDSLAAPWMDVSWSSVVNYANTTPVFSGTRSIRVDETGWGALSVHSGPWGGTQPRSPASYASVQFEAYTTSSNVTLYVQLENDAHASFPVVTAGSLPVNQWVSFSVSLSQLAPAGTSFDRIDVGNRNGTNATFFVDDLQLTGP